MDQDGPWLCLLGTIWIMLTDTERRNLKWAAAPPMLGS